MSKTTFWCGGFHYFICHTGSTRLFLCTMCHIVILKRFILQRDKKLMRLFWHNCVSFACATIRNAQIICQPSTVFVCPSLCVVLGDVFFVSRRFASRIIHEIGDLKKALVLSVRAEYTRFGE